MYYRGYRKKRSYKKFVFIFLLALLAGLAVFLSRDIEPESKKTTQPVSIPAETKQPENNTDVKTSD